MRVMPEETREKIRQSVLKRCPVKVYATNKGGERRVVAAKSKTEARRLFKISSHDAYKWVSETPVTAEEIVALQEIGTVWVATGKKWVRE